MKKPAKVYIQKLGIDHENVAKLEVLQHTKEASSTASLLLECFREEASLKQASLLKKIGVTISTLASAEDNTLFQICLEVLAQLFTVLDYKNPARRALTSLFDGLPNSTHQATVNCLSSAICHKLEDVANHIGMGECNLRSAVDMVSSSMENFKLGNMVISSIGLQVLRYLATYLQHFVMKASSVPNPVDQTVMMTNCLAATKTIIAVLHKTSQHTIDATHSSWIDILEAIATQLIVILNNDFLPDCKTASGMALCLIICLSANHKTLGQLILKTIFPHYKSEEDTNQQTIPQQVWMLQVMSLQKWQCPVSFAQLCMCHGLLTMVPLEELVEPMDHHKAGSGCSTTLLFDVLFHDLCLLCESMKEPFSCLSAFRVLSLWAEQARNATLPDNAPLSLKSQVIGSAAIPQKLLSFVWDHWDHPVEIVRYQTKAIFEHVVNMHVAVSGQDPSDDIFLKDLVGKLLLVGWHSRGIYGPLCCMTSVTGAKCLLGWYPCIAEQVLSVLNDRTTAPHAIDFIDAMSKNHKQEILSAEENMDAWLKTWIVPIINLLRHQGSAQESVHIEQTLSKLLRCYPESLQFIVKNLQKHYNKNIEILITCLKSARALGLIKVNDHDDGSNKETWGKVVPVMWLEKALCHVEEQTRLDALGLLCDSPRTTEPISVTDIALLKVFLPLNINNQSPSFRQQCSTHLKKLLMRMKESLRISAKKLVRTKDDKILINRVKTYKEYLHWFGNLLFASLFPEASFSRRTTALHLLKLLSTIFTDVKQGTNREPFLFNDVMTTSNVTVLLECLRDSYDVNKVLAYELLTSCPTNKLPFQSHDTLQPWLQRLDILLTSPRAVDATTANVTLKLLIEKCTLALYLDSDKPNHEDAVNNGVAVESQVFRVLCFLLKCLKTQRSIAERSLNLAASQAPMNGAVYCVREILGHLPLRQFSRDSSWQQLVSSVLDECLHVAKLVSPVVTSSSPEGHMIDDDYDDDGGEGGEHVFNPSSQILLVCCWRTMKEVALLLGDLVQSAPIMTSDHNSMTSKGIKPDVTTKSMTSNQEFLDREVVLNDVKAESITSEPLNNDVIKESSTSEETHNDVIARTMTSFPTSNEVKTETSKTRMSQNDVGVGSMTSNVTHNDVTAGLLTSSQVRRIGEFFTTVLLTSKHHGAFELAYNGFVKLCTTLWTCADSQLRELPLEWLNALLADIAGCVPSDVLCGTRRSAGVPFFVQAIVSTEPVASGKACLKRVMNELLQVASQPIDELVDKDSTLPQVHARNILRALYRDTRLGEDVFPFVANGLKVAISGFLSDSWAVRNSSTLLFSALMTRIFGVKKSKDEHSRRNCMTGREFFTRFPELHSFLVDQLKQATEGMGKTSAFNLHPSLYPVLVLLSRLYPSTLDGADSTLNMAAFVPYVIRCGNSSVLKTRSMAARAIVPLVTGESMVETMQELMRSLPKCVSHSNQNKMHGTLLQIQHLIKDHLVQSTATDLVKSMVTTNMIPMLEPVLWIATRCNPCDVTRAVFLDIALDLIVCPNLQLKEPNLDKDNDVIISQIRKTIIQTTLAESITNEGPRPLVGIGQSHLKEVCARILLTTAEDVGIPEKTAPTTASLSTSAENDGSDKSPMDCLPMTHCDVVCSLLASRDYEVRLVALQHLSTNLSPFFVSLPRVHKPADILKDEEANEIFEREDLRGIASTLLEMAVGKEKHLDCLGQVYRVLSYLMGSISFPHTFSTGKRISLIECWQYILTQGRDSLEQRDGIKCALLDLLASMTNVVYQTYSISRMTSSQDSIRDSLRGFSSLLKSSSEESKSFDVRLKTADILSSGALGSLLWDPCKKLGDFPLELWEAVVNLLHDDDVDIRNTAARVIQTETETTDQDILTPTLATQHVLRTVYTHFYTDQPRATLQWMLGWIVAHDTVQDAATHHNDLQSELDLLFEKNSLNSYLERVVIAHNVVQCLKDMTSLPNEPKNSVTNYVSRNQNDVTCFLSDVRSHQRGDVTCNPRTLKHDVTCYEGNVTSDVTCYQSDVVDDVEMKCVRRLQYILQENELDVSKHFYITLSNVLGLVATGVLKMSSQKMNNTQSQPDSTSLAMSNLTLSEQGDKCAKTPTRIKDIVLILISNAKLAGFVCHPVMKNAVRDLCHIYGIQWQL